MYARTRAGMLGLVNLDAFRVEKLLSVIMPQILVVSTCWKHYVSDIPSHWCDLCD